MLIGLAWHHAPWTECPSGGMNHGTSGAKEKRKAFHPGGESVAHTVCASCCMRTPFLPAVSFTAGQLECCSPSWVLNYLTAMHKVEGLPLFDLISYNWSHVDLIYSDIYILLFSSAGTQRGLQLPPPFSLSRSPGKWARERECECAKGTQQAPWQNGDLSLCLSRPYLAFPFPLHCASCHERPMPNTRGPYHGALRERGKNSLFNAYFTI